MDRGLAERALTVSVGAMKKGMLAASVGLPFPGQQLSAAPAVAATSLVFQSSVADEGSGTALMKPPLVLSLVFPCCRPGASFAVHR